MLKLADDCIQGLYEAAGKGENMSASSRNTRGVSSLRTQSKGEKWAKKIAAELEDIAAEEVMKTLKEEDFADSGSRKSFAERIKVGYSERV